LGRNFKRSGFVLQVILWGFSQDLATLAENGENRMLISPFTSALFQLHTLN
jgi:hypothetical protein